MGQPGQRMSDSIGKVLRVR